MNGKVRVLRLDQYADPRKGCFLVKVEATKQRYQGERVYVSCKGTPHEFKFILI